MRLRMFGLVLVGGMVLGHAGTAKAQIGVTIGNPYTGGITIGQPMGYGYAYPSTGYGYSSTGYGYSSYYGVPGTTTVYSSGYSGLVAPGVGSFGNGYVATPGYAYPGTVYAPYAGYGSTVYGLSPRAYRQLSRRGWGW